MHEVHLPIRLWCLKGKDADWEDHFKYWCIFHSSCTFRRSYDVRAYFHFHVSPVLRITLCFPGLMWNRRCDDFSQENIISHDDGKISCQKISDQFLKFWDEIVIGRYCLMMIMSRRNWIAQKYKTLTSIEFMVTRQPAAKERRFKGFQLSEESSCS